MGCEDSLSSCCQRETSTLLSTHYSSFLASDADAASQSEQMSVLGSIGRDFMENQLTGTAEGSGACALPALLSIS